MEFRSSSEEQTLEFAANLAAKAEKGTIFALHGNLGAGKTLFSRGFASGLGITEAVTSPTFTIVQEYNIPMGGKFYHLDLYRIQNDDEAIIFGIDEFILDEDSISLIEWPERIPELLPEHTIHIYFSHIDENTRLIKIEEL